MGKVNLRLESLNKEERANMATVLDFLFNPDRPSKDIIINLVSQIYGNKYFNIVSDNGHTPIAYHATTYEKDKHWFTLARFEENQMTSEALDFFGRDDDRDFRRYYGLGICKEDGILYAVSLQERCSPNWNNAYLIGMVSPLKELSFPILKTNGTICAMCDTLHDAINNKIWSEKPLFLEEGGVVSMAVKDQHGNYCYIKGPSVDNVFRDYADNYTDYRSYRNQMASEWRIADPVTRQRYEEWKKSAAGLKSSFDKFYGGGIVD